MAMSRPASTSPAMVRTLIVVNQYSISPYRLTFRRLNVMGNTRKIEMKIAGFRSDQNAIKFAAAAILFGKSIA